MRSGPTHRTSFYFNYLFKKKKIYLLIYFIFGCAVSATAQRSFSIFSPQSADSGMCRLQHLWLKGSGVLAQ